MTPRNQELAMAVARDGRPKYLIAALSGMPGNHLGGIISGRVAPTSHNQLRIAEVLDAPVDQLFGAS